MNIQREIVSHLWQVPARKAYWKLRLHPFTLMTPLFATWHTDWTGTDEKRWHWCIGFWPVIPLVDGGVIYRWSNVA